MKVTSIKAQAGYTLVEIILALVIASAMLGTGYKWYQTYRLEQDLAQIRYNVDILFQAMAHYYQANCRDRSTSTGDPDKTATGQGALSPSKIIYPPEDSVAIDLTELRTQGYLTAAQPLSIPIVSSYVLQFNPSVTTRNIYACNPAPPGAASTACTAGESAPIKSSLVVIWRAQVAVLLNKKYDSVLYAGILGANCTSNTSGLGVIKPCKPTASPTPPGPGPTPPSPPPTTGDYIVWERLPSFASSTTTTELWPSLSVAKQFNQQYTNDAFSLQSNVFAVAAAQ